MSARFHKLCACGARYTLAAWLHLPLVGRMEDGDGGELALRNCEVCDSTLGAPAKADLLGLAETIQRLRRTERSVAQRAGDLSGSEEEVIAAQALPAHFQARLKVALGDWFELTHARVLGYCPTHGESLLEPRSCDDCARITSEREAAAPRPRLTGLRAS